MRFSTKIHFDVIIFFSLFSCIRPDLCDDNRNKLSLNPFGAFAAESFAASEDVLNGLISSAQNAKCPDEGDVCCSKEFTKEVSVDCVISPWSSCSQSCGPGTQNRTILVPAKNGGEECTGNLDRACNERNCPGKRLSKVSFFSEDITLLVRSPIFANILLLLNIFQYTGMVKCLQKLAI